MGEGQRRLHSLIPQAPKTVRFVRKNFWGGKALLLGMLVILVILQRRRREAYLTGEGIFAAKMHKRAQRAERQGRMPLN